MKPPTAKSCLRGITHFTHFTCHMSAHSRLVVPQSGNPMMLGTGRSDMSILNINCWGIYTYTDPSIYDNKHIVYIQSNITRHLKMWHLCKYRCSKFPNITKITGLGNNNTDQYWCPLMKLIEFTGLFSGQGRLQQREVPPLDGDCHGKYHERMDDVTGGTTMTLGNLHIYVISIIGVHVHHPVCV